MKVLGRLTALSIVLACTACSGNPKADLPWPVRPTGELVVRAAIEPREGDLLAPVVVTVDLWSEADLAATCTLAIPAGFASAAPASAVAKQELHGGRWQRWTLPLRPTRTGELTVPPFKAKATSPNGREIVATCAELTFTSHPLLPEDKGQIEAPAAPFEPLSWWLAHPKTVLAGLALVCLPALLWRWWRRARARGAEYAAIPPPPHTKALRALARLRNEPRISTEQIERFHVELARILRLYLEERFGLHAPERTTEEFFAEAQRSVLLDASQLHELSAFLGHCDLVKFARLVPGDDEHMRVFGTVERFVEATRPDRATAPQPAASELTSGVLA